MAEKGVAITKNILKRCYETNEIELFQHRILEYNTTPVASLQLTPSQLFLGRILKTKLPISDTLLQRNNISEQVIQSKIEKKKEKQKYYYDRGAKSLPILNIGDKIIFKKNGNEWNYGIITGNINNRSYIVRDNFNNNYRRNRRFIAKTVHSEFNPSDLVFEDNIRVNISDNNLNNLVEINIVPPSVNNSANNSLENSLNNSLDDSIDDNNYVTADESEVSMEPNQLDQSFDGTIVPESMVEENANISPTDDYYHTRSGRAVRPPKRYGFD